MPTETIIRTLKEAKQENPKHILPRTVLKAVADENGDFISSDVTAQDINQLHGKTLVTANAQTLTDAQKAKARANINAAAPDGYYGNSGGVMQYSTNFFGKNTPTAVKDLVFRPTTSAMIGTAWSADSISGDAAIIERIKGKTLVWNQLNNNGTGDKTENGVTFTKNGDGSWIINGTATDNAAITFSDYNRTVPANHKIFVGFGIRNAITGVNLGRSGFSFPENVDFIHSYSSDFSAKPQLRVEIGTTVNNLKVYPMVVDLTQMFGAGNEPATVEEFRAMFPLDYYDYNEGELISFNGTLLQTTGFNQLDSEGHIHVIGGMTYRIEGAYTSLVDSAGNAVTVTDNEFIPAQDDTYTMVGGSCVHLKWSGVRDGDTEDYWQRQLALPIAQYFPDGMKSAGTVYDELTKDKAIKRIGSRAYQEGDEDDTTVVTDGTTTLYALETPVITPISPELNLTYKVDDFGTEKLLPENTAEPVTTPMDADIMYQLDYEAQVRNNDQINISKPSMDNFIASFNASGLGTITQTYNPNTKQYEYTVTAPQPTEGGETV